MLMRFNKEIKRWVSTGLLVVFSSMHAMASTVVPSYMVFASDPQYPWTPSSDSGAPETGAQRDSLSRTLVEAQYSSIAQFRETVGGAREVPVLINGDMTAFGHGWQRSTVKEILNETLGGQYDYGLGNHDYQNNVDDCAFNSCAADSINDYKDRYWVSGNNIDFYARASGRVKIYYGSLAYSKDIGDVHLVQLNNEPTYAVKFSAGITSAVSYEITDALDWLERDLMAARAKGRIIILNMHKPDRWQGSAAQIKRFEKMLSDYKVTAIFAGHYHWRSGYFKEINGVPVYLSGSASEQTYLIASFSADGSELIIERAKNNNWQDRQQVHVTAVRK